MPRPKFVSMRMLHKAGACAEQIESFHELFPRGGRVNVENVTRARNDGLDLGWAVNNLLTPRGRKMYYELRDAAWDKFQLAIAPHHKKYVEATLAYKGDPAAILRAWNAYEKVEEKERNAFRLACDAAFVLAWFVEEGS